METVLSTDGTSIAFDRVGDGPVIVIAAGALCDRTSFAGLAEILAPTYTVVNYDRRGRGDSGDRDPYEPEREVEDLAAVIAANGGADVNVMGHSSGAMLGLEAAAAGVAMARLVAYEPPYVARYDPALLPAIQAHLADGRPDLAVETFILDTGMPAGPRPPPPRSPAPARTPSPARGTTSPTTRSPSSSPTSSAEDPRPNPGAL